MGKNKSNISRDEIIKEATSLHDQLLGTDHCDRKYLHSCAALQQCIPQAAANIKKRQEKSRG